MIIVTVFLYITLTSAQDAPFTSKPLWALTAQTPKLFTSRELLITESSTPINPLKETEKMKYTPSSINKYITSTERTTQRLFTSKLLSTTQLPITDDDQSDMDLSLYTRVQSITRKNLPQVKKRKSSTLAPRTTTTTTTEPRSSTTPASRTSTTRRSRLTSPTTKFTSQSSRITRTTKVPTSTPIRRNQYVTTENTIGYNRNPQNPHIVLTSPETVYYKNRNSVMTSSNEGYSNDQPSSISQNGPSQTYTVNVGTNNGFPSFNMDVGDNQLELVNNKNENRNNYKLIVYV